MQAFSRRSNRTAADDRWIVDIHGCVFLVILVGEGVLMMMMVLNE
jgi:hypothetical protein